MSNLPDSGVNVRLQCQLLYFGYGLKSQVDHSKNGIAFSFHRTIALITDDLHYVMLLD